MTNDETEEAIANGAAAFFSKLSLTTDQKAAALSAGVGIFQMVDRKYARSPHRVEEVVAVLGAALLFAEGERRRRMPPEGQNDDAPHGVPGR